MNSLSNEANVGIVRIAALALAFALAGCASTGTQNGSASTPPATAPKPASTAPAPKPASTPAPAASAPSGDMGTVVFFRESKFAGAAVSFKVREGETELGKLSSGSYFIAQVPTGPHAFTVHSEAKDILNLEVEKGETYYVQGSISMGVLVGRPNLSPATAETFNGMKDKLKNSAEPKKK